MSHFLTIRDVDLKDKRVLVRVDYNVPLDDEGKITDDTRIRTSLPTLEYILNHGGKPILMSHLGRPKGKDPTLSLKACATRLQELLHKEVLFAPDCIGEKIEKQTHQLKPNQILLLENLRFHKGEEHPETDPGFAKALADFGDVYVDDAFGTAHRAHSSTATITQYFPGKAVGGLLLEKEVNFLGTHFQNPSHPFYAIIGGAKISSKLGVLNSLLKKVDALFIGGGMAFTFLKAKGIAIGNSLCELELLHEAAEFLKQAEQKNIPVYLPDDLIIANAFTKDAEHKIITASEGIPEGWQGMDIGPMTRNSWRNTLQTGKMVFWNGPLGVFEFPAFSHGTKAIAETLANLNAITIVGGGDSVAAVNQLGLADRFSHISTGGGASLEFIEYGHLPGIDALSPKS